MVTHGLITFRLFASQHYTSQQKCDVQFVGVKIIIQKKTYSLSIKVSDNNIFKVDYLYKRYLHQ